MKSSGSKVNELELREEADLFVRDYGIIISKLFCPKEPALMEIHCLPPINTIH